MRAIGLFSDVAYYPALVAVVNSILHFQVQARIKVYDFDGLPHLLRSHLGRFAEVVQPPAAILGNHYREHFYYRPRFLAAAGIERHELLLDADMVVLSDLEEAFREIEAGRVVAVREWRYVHPDSLREWNYRDLPAASAYHRLLAHPEIYKEGLPIYNGGLLGFNRDRHGDVLDLWRQGTEHHEELADTFFALDQHSLSLILASLRREGRVEVHELPPELWMQTWAGHREPRKLLAFEGGSPALYNGDPARAMRCYHHTGDILAPPALVGGGETRLPVRFSHLVSDLGLPAGVTRRQMEAAWHHVWRTRHRSPAGELPLFFYNLGPVRAPRCIDPSWRESLARLLGELRDGVPAGAAGGGPPDAAAWPPDRDSPAVWALAFAYDYLDACGYRAGDLGWLARPLAILLGAERAAAPGAPAVTWEGEGDLAIGFAPRFAERREWTGGAPGGRARYAEHHRGVYLNVA